MASELRVNTLKDASGNNSVGMSTVAEGTAKVIWDLDGTGTIALQDSFNVSSAVDNGTGYYTINYTNSFATVNNMPLSHTINVVAFDCTLTGAKDASSAQFYTMNATDGTLQDSKPFGSTHGDLA